MSDRFGGVVGESAASVVTDAAAAGEILADRAGVETEPVALISAVRPLVAAAGAAEPSSPWAAAACASEESALATLARLALVVLLERVEPALIVVAVELVRPVLRALGPVVLSFGDVTRPLPPTLGPLEV